MFGLGKKRSRLGKWLDRNGYNQEDLVKASKVNRNTVSKLCTDEEYVPSGGTMRKILSALRSKDPNVKSDDFWSM